MPDRLFARQPLPPPAQHQQALVDVLDQLLDTGVVLDGQLVISLAGVDLIHVGLRALLASVDTAARLVTPAPPALP
ncbi:MAG: gas vesicle protein [Acetobacteraceae bacterium]|nr:MAG: gas vesicle protein [Acetobacteraceae bacterium]